MGWMGGYIGRGVYMGGRVDGSGYMDGYVSR